MSQQRMGFGPWSSALDNGTRLELSAFWRRRMAGLARLPLGRTSRRWMVATTIAILLVGALPLVEFVPALAEAEEVEKNEIPKGTAQLFLRAAPPNADERRAMDALQAKRLELTKRLGETGLYALAPGEVIKFVPAADVGKLRQDYVGLMSDDDRRMTALFQLNEGRPQESSWTYGELDLARTLDFIFGLKLHRLRGDERLFTVPMPEGDWVCGFDPRDKPPLTPELVASLEKTLSQGLGMPLKLSLTEEKGPTLVAHGDYKAAPMADETGAVQLVTGKVAERADGTFFFPARRGLTTGSVGNFRALLEDVGELLLTPIVDEVASRPTKQDFFWNFPRTPHVEFLTPLGEADRNQVIAAFEKQTGLALTPEEREVEMLVITSGATENE
jgi:hypothetical protein